tara:strand:+ start:832 stop:1029 length:198 start_codon:yes stop_codon:yes gene_type:complete
MKPGDLVRIRKSAITAYSTLWFVDLAERKAPLLVMEELNKRHWKVMRPNGTTFFVEEKNLTKRMW